MSGFADRFSLGMLQANSDFQFTLSKLRRSISCFR
jgi:hypothetical protein